MPVSLNKVVLAGMVSRGVRFQKTQKGKSVCNYTLKIPSFGNSHTYVDITSWGDQADKAKAFAAGDEAIVTGRLTSESYEKEGRKIFRLSVVSDSIDKVVQTKAATSENPEAAA